MSQPSAGGVDSPSTQGEAARRQMREVAERIRALCASARSDGDFYRELLPILTQAMGADGGVIWQVIEGGLEVAAQQNFAEGPLCPAPAVSRQRSAPADGAVHPGEGPTADQLRHLRLVSRAARQEEPITVPPYASDVGNSEVGNPSNHLLVLAPIRVGETPAGLIEILQRPVNDSGAIRGYERFLSQVAEMVARRIEDRRLKSAAAEQGLWREANQLSEQFHRSLDLRQTAYTVANEGRRFADCDRVSVMVKRWGAWKPLAISGQDSFDNRSDAVTGLKRLTRVVGQAGEVVWSDQLADAPPQIADAVSDYLDASHTKSLVIVPLAKQTSSAPADQPAPPPRKANVFAAIVFEQIEGYLARARHGRRLELVCRHGETALLAAREHSQLALAPADRATKALSWLFSRGRAAKTTAVIAVATAIILAALLVPISFNLKGDATLVPKATRDVFVHTPGVVQEVLVEHGQFVEAGQPLLKLRNVDLEVAWEDTLGQRQTAYEELLSVQRTSLERPGMDAVEQSQLSGRRRELRQRLESLDRQLLLIKLKQQKLTVRSPIAGQVITWNLEELLDRRPVTEGQLLLTVADPSHGWRLEVDLPEKRLGHVLTAKGESQAPLKVSYVMSSDPGQTHEGTLEEVSLRSEADKEAGQTIRLHVAIDGSELTDPRPGATATAKVHCGEACVAYVWLHEVWAFVQRRVLF